MSESSPEEITKKSKSNLAFALYCLPKKRRADMITFYAFCRTVDDLADETDKPREERKSELLKWKNGIVNGFSSPDIIQSGVEELIDRYEIDRDLFIELIKGMEMDFNEENYDTFEDLKLYCYRVASVVGLISLKLFGANLERASDYAINLGYALQLTNIIRDISEDYSAGRIYLPREEVVRFGLSSENLIESANTENFLDLMKFQAARAEFYYNAANESLDPSDFKALKAARAMAKIYRTLLTKMKKDNFKVTQKRYRINLVNKIFLMLSS